MGDDDSRGRAAMPPAQPDDWDAARERLVDEEQHESLTIDIDGFSGPLDLLLALARTQKVDLTQISVLELAERYLAFIAEARQLRLALAADYLVMAAWLTFLKSRLLLPKEQAVEDEISGEELAQRLAFRLMRLDAMRNAAATLMTRHRLGRDVFARGYVEPLKVNRETTFKADLYELLKAYAEQRNRTVKRVHVVKARRVWSIKDARRRLEAMVGPVGEAWLQLDMCLEEYMPGDDSRSALAASFGASLELAREGVVELRQDGAFEPIFLRKASQLRAGSKTEAPEPTDD